MQSELEKKIRALFRWNSSLEQLEAVRDKRTLPTRSTSPQEEAQFKDNVAQSVIMARKTSPFAEYFIDLVMNSPDFSFLFSEESNPNRIAFYVTGNHCIAFPINAPLIRYPINELLYTESILHEFTHAFFNTIYSKNRNPRLDLKGNLRVAPPDKEQSQAISKAINDGNQRLLWLLDRMQRDPQSFEQTYPDLFKTVRTYLENYLPHADIMGFGQLTCTKIQSKYTNCFNAIKEIDNGKTAPVWSASGETIIAKQYSRDKNGSYFFPGFLVEKGAVATPSKIILAINDVKSFSSERYKPGYAEKIKNNPDAEHILLGEKLAHWAQLNYLNDFYPETIRLIATSVKKANQELGWKNSGEETRIHKKLRASAANMTKLLDAFSNTELLDDVTDPDKSAEEFAKEQEERQLNLAAGLYGLLTLPSMVSPVLSLMIKGGAQLLQLTTETITNAFTEPASVETEETPFSTLVPVAVVATTAVAVGISLWWRGGFWSTQKEAPSKTKAETTNDAPYHPR